MIIERARSRNREPSQLQGTDLGGKSSNRGRSRGPSQAPDIKRFTDSTKNLSQDLDIGLGEEAGGEGIESNVGFRSFARDHRDLPVPIKKALNADDLI